MVGTGIARKRGSLFGPGVGFVGGGTVCDCQPIDNGAPPAPPFLVPIIFSYFSYFEAL